MIDPERIRNLVERMGNRDDALEFVRQMRCGGKKFKKGGEKDGKSGGVKDWLRKKAVDYYYNHTVKPAIDKNGLDEVRLRLYDHVSPFSYDNADIRVEKALSTPHLGGTDRKWAGEDIRFSDSRYRDDIWRTYLGVPESAAHISGWNPDRVVESKYRPTIGGDQEKYYTINRDSQYYTPYFDTKEGLFGGGKDDELVNMALTGEPELPYTADGAWPMRYGETRQSDILGRYFGDHAVSRGVDPQRGDYVSFYDLWDLAPSEGKDRKGGADESHGIGTPIPFYDRLYLDDYFGVNSRPQNPDEFYGGYLTPAIVGSKDYACGGRKFDGGGKYFRTNLDQESPMMYEPMPYVGNPIVSPLRFRPQPDNGDYVEPTSTGMMENYPITTGISVPERGISLVLPEPEEREPVVDLFSPEAKAERRLMQRYVESRYNNNAQSPVGAKGPWQIMDITLKDYLGRGRGKQGNIFDPEYNGQIRDWVMSIIPRDLGEFWSDDDSDINKLAKLYAAYNWGAGNLRKFFKKRLAAGLTNDDPYEWVEAIKNNDETKNYVKFLALNQDIPDSYMTREKFEELSKKKGYMAEGGRLFEMGGPEGDEKRKGLLNREKIANRVPGDGSMHGGTNGVLSALGHYLHNDDNYVEERLNDAITAAEYGDAAPDLASLLAHEDAKRIYLGLPQKYYSFEPSPYRPTIGTSENPYQLNALLSDDEFDNTILPMWGTWKTGQDWPVYDTASRVKDLGRTAQLRDIPVLQAAGLSEGYDDNGQYLSLYDTWDYNRKIKNANGDNIGWLIGGKPFDIYQRYYLDDWLDIPEEAKGNPYIAPSYIEADYTGGYGKGGKIRIKPENRGKFTALKKRTGHSASWFKAHGTPAQKKMAVFALNAKKWKHGDGGFMNYYDGETENTGLLKRFLSTPTRVPNMTGTATAAPAFLRDIPLTDSTVGKELAVAGTALSSLAGPLAINWLSNPANQIIAAKIGIPLIAGSAVENGVRSYTPYSSVGNLLYNAPVVPWSNWSPAYSQARRGAPRWERELTEGLLGFANPGYYVSPEIMAPAMDKVMRGMAGDFAAHVKEPLNKGKQYAKDWYDFVVKGNDSRYKNALENVLTLGDEESMLGAALRNFEDAAAKYPKFSIKVRDAVTDVGDIAASSMKMYPSEVMYGADRIPMVVEDIGMPGRAKVTYLQRVPDGETSEMFTPLYDRVDFENVGRGLGNQIYESGTELYRSPLTGEYRRYPSDVLEKPKPGPGRSFISSGGDDEFIEKYTMDVANGSHIPVQRGESTGAAKIAKHIDEDVMPFVGDDVALTGSTVLYKNRILSGKPGDYEFLVAEEDLPAFQAKLKMTGAHDNGFALEGNSPLLRAGNGSHNVDAQIVRSDSYGEANGKVAWSLFKTMHPVEYEAQAANSIGLNKNFYDMHIINPSTGLPYKPKELIAEFKAGGYDTQHVINEAMAISKPYYKSPKGNLPGTESGAIDLLKQDRALSLLTSKDSRVKEMVRKAIDDNARTSLGANYVHGHEFFPGLDFGNVENNKEFLKHLKINPNNIADDPEMMRNIFDQWFLVRTSRYREVSNMPNMAGVKTAVGTGNVPLGGGSATASGRNTVTGGYFGSTVGDPQRGMFQQMPTYRTEMSDMSDMKDIINMFKRTEEGYKFTSQEADELNNELISIFTDMQSDMSIREGGIGRRGAGKILNELKSRPIRTLADLDEFFNKGRGMLQKNGLSDITASDVIQRVSEKLDIPEFIATGRWGYQNKYAGIWDRRAPKAASYRYVDDPYWKPFEVGRDFVDFGVSSAGGSGQPIGLSLSEASFLPDDASRNLMRAIYESGASGTDARTLMQAGASPVYSEKATNALRNHLERIQNVNKAGEQEVGYLKRYSDMPFAKRRIKDVEYDTGLSYRDGKVYTTGERLGGRSKRAIADDILKTAPFDTKYGYIRDIKTAYNGDGYIVRAVDDNGKEIEYIVSKDKNSWKWDKRSYADDDLTFALGGYINRLNSVYGNNLDKIRQAIQNARLKQK